MKIQVDQIYGIYSWKWDVPEDELCGICRVPFDGACPACKYPGDQCPIGKHISWIYCSLL